MTEQLHDRFTLNNFTVELRFDEEDGAWIASWDHDSDRYRSERNARERFNEIKEEIVRYCNGDSTTIDGVNWF